MSFGLYMDHNAHGAITAGLRRRGIDCLTAEEDGKARAADTGILERATELGRVLFSHDDDLLVIGVECQRKGREFAGVVYAAQLGVTIGRAIDDLELIVRTLTSAEMRNHIEYLPL